MRAAIGRKDFFRFPRVEQADVAVLASAIRRSTADLSFSGSLEPRIHREQYDGAPAHAPRRRTGSLGL